MSVPTPLDARGNPMRFEPMPAPSRPPIRGLVIAAVTTVTILFGGFGTWAALAPLTSAAMAPGVVTVETNRKTIQHMEGGIIREILVRDGELVKKGQVLVRLDSLDADADRNAVRARLDALIAQEARLVAERDGRTSIAFPAELLAQRDDPMIREMLDGQEGIFEDRQRSLRDQVDVLVQRAEQLRAQIAAVEAQNDAIKAQLPLFEEELADQRYLFEKGLTQKSKWLALERQDLAAKGEIAANESNVISLKEQIAEVEGQIKAVLSASATSVSEELRDAQIERSEVMEQLRKFEAKAGRTDVVAPEDGAILNMNFFTVGGVVPPGGVILDLVPLEDKLVFEVKVQPLDIDTVRPELPATVRLVAYKQRNTPTLEGVVSWVSADATIDEKTNATYFLARVEVSAAELRRVPHVKLYPGMPVDVSIVTGERTLLAYLVQPLTDSLATAFRED
jgi:HlyD family type I secretion membrane fusion protein